MVHFLSLAVNAYSKRKGDRSRGTRNAILNVHQGIKQKTPPATTRRRGFPLYLPKTGHHNRSTCYQKPYAASTPT